MESRPINRTSDEVEFSCNPQDIADGRAFLEIPWVGKILLAHMAGAPWSDKDADAHLSAIQAECTAHKERERIIEGASRLGKSVLGGLDLICAMLLPLRKVAIVAKRYDHVAHEFQYLYGGMHTLFDGHPQAFKRLVFKHQTNYHDYDCEPIWGSRCQGFSVEADEGASLLGREITDLVLGEGSHIDPEIFEKKALRAVDGATMERSHGLVQEIGRVSIYTTPKGYEGCSASEYERVLSQTQHHPERLEYDNAPSWAASVWIRTASIAENPAYSLEVLEARRASMDPIAFKEQYLGLKTYKTGAIFPTFDEIKHIRKRPSNDEIREMRLGVGIDTGAYTGIVLVGIDPQHNFWILDEVYAQKPPRGIFDSMEWLKEMVVGVLGPVFETEDFDLLKECVALWSVDPASQHKLEIIDLLDIPLSGPVDQEQKRLLATIDTVGNWITNDRLYVVDDCTFLIDQMKKYIWKQVKTVGAKTGSRVPVIREPKKEYDHLIDAMRFILIPLDKDGPLDEPPPVITLAGQVEMEHREIMFGDLKREMAAGQERYEALYGRTG